MEKRLLHVRIAVLATDGFEQSELEEPVRAYREEGAEVHIVSPKAGSIRGWKHKDWGTEVKVDLELSKAKSADFDALHLPGGVINPDLLRMDPQAVEFVREFLRENKPIGAICHGPWTLIEADAVRGRTMTSWPSLKTDLRNAGAYWVDRETVEDRGLITSRKPDDIPAYIEKTVQQFSLAAQVSTF
jgi:protease I